MIAAVSAAMLCGSLWWWQRPYPTVRPMPVDPSLSNEQARDAAESTVRAWVTAFIAHNVADLRALSCDRDARKYAIPFSSEEPHPAFSTIDAVTTGRFERAEPIWALSVFYRSSGAGYGGRVFKFSTAHNELRICDVAVPEPW
ncbi:hypothetical protein JNN96_26530 [Mycobacterium sp. DSM 3803]|nr:hypothetical protein [Mycobacterium sp. DSM 3803]